MTQSFCFFAYLHHGVIASQEGSLWNMHKGLLTASKIAPNFFDQGVIPKIACRGSCGLAEILEFTIVLKAVVSKMSSHCFHGPRGFCKLLFETPRPLLTAPHGQSIIVLRCPCGFSNRSRGVRLHPDTMEKVSGYVQEPHAFIL